MPRRIFLTALSILCGFLPLRALAAIVINEVLWSGSDKSTSDEWIEITSTGSGSHVTESMDGWTLTGMNSSGIEVVLHRFGSGATVASGSYLALSHWPADQSRLAIEPDFVVPSLTLANTKLLLRLRDAQGIIKDEVDDGVGVPFAGSNASPPAWKASMERISRFLPGNVSSNWKTALTFLNTDDGTPLFATPGAPNFTGPSVDTFAPWEATDITAEVTDIGTDRSIRLRWTPSESLDLQSQSVTIEPAPLVGSGVIRFSPSASGYMITFIDQTISYVITLQSTDKNQNISDGVEIEIEPLNTTNTENNNSDQSSSQSSGSSSAESSSQSTSFSSVGSDVGSSESSTSGSSSSASFSSDSYASSAAMSSSFPSSSSSASSSFVSSASFESFGSSSSLLTTTDTPRIIITELLPDPSGSDDNQWIELWNPGPDAVDLSSWSVRNVQTAKVLQLSGSLLSGQYLLKTRGDGLFALSHGGGELALLHGDTTVQTLVFPSLPENVTYGLADALQAPRAYCAPTPGHVNSDVGWNPAIQVQSGVQEGESSVSINLQTVTPEGMSNPVSCRYDFGDGAVANTCNPPSHSFGTVGDYTITADAVSYCGTTVKQQMQIHVLPKPNSTPASATPSASGGSDPAPSPVSQTVTAPSGISISAVLPNPAGTDPGNEWVELFNAGQAGTDLAGLLLRSGSKSFPLEGIVLGAGQTVRLSDLRTKLTLTNSSGSVSLRTTDGLIVSSLQWKDARDNVIYGSASSNTRVEVDLVTIIDGDTIDVFFRKGTQSPAGGTGSARVRFIGIDAPEIHHANPFEIEMGLQAKNYLSSLIENKKIELEFDTEKQDSYGRLLAYIYASGVPVQERILEDGMASVLSSYDFSKKQLYLELQEEAKGKRTGHWGNKNAVMVLAASASGDLFPVQNIVSMAGLVISEVYPVPASGEDEWIELLNTSADPIPLRGLIIDDVANGGSKPWTYSGSLTIDAGDFVAIPLTGSKVQLNNDGDTVSISSPDGVIIDQIMYAKVKQGMSYALSDSGSYCITTEPTPHEYNKCTEIVFSNGSKTKSAASVKSKKTSAKPKVTYKNIIQSAASSQASVEGMGLELAGSLTGSDEQQISAPGSMHLPELFLLTLLASGGSGYVGAVVAMRRRWPERGTTQHV